MKSINNLDKLIKKRRQFYYSNFSYKEYKEINYFAYLFSLMSYDSGGIRLFLMSYYSGGMSLGHSEINYDLF